MRDAQRLLDLHDRERELAFVRLWCVAEACATATGQGLRMLLTGVGPLGFDPAGTLGDLCWAVTTFADGEACAVACDRRAATGDCLARPLHVAVSDLLEAA